MKRFTTVLVPKPRNNEVEEKTSLTNRVVAHGPFGSFKIMQSLTQNQEQAGGTGVSPVLVGAWFLIDEDFFQEQFMARKTPYTVFES